LSALVLSIVFLCNPLLVYADISTLANRQLETLAFTSGRLNVSSVSPPAAASCKTVTVNAQGTAGADITIDNTATGITVLAASTTRCGALVKNVGSNQIRCGPTSHTLTATVYGVVVEAGQTLTFGLEAQEAWKCIRTGGSNSTVNIAEMTP
jgi:hypothetical protein